MKILNESIGQDATLQIQLWEDSKEFQTGKKRPVIVVVPGGGYRFCSGREADPVANTFFAMGYHAAVLRYTTEKGAYPTQLCQLASAVALLRRNAEAWFIDPEKIVVLGFSAGGHLTANLGVCWHTPWLAEAVGASNEEIRPNYLVLCYAVLVAGEYGNVQSWRNLLGDDWEEKWLSMSLEKQVTEQTPPCFLWANGGDTTVPLENSMLFAAALRKNGVPFELHCYEKGRHGLSLVTETVRKKPETKLYRSVAMWVEQCHLWLEQQFDPEFV